jgi:hypothetical protein
MTKEMRRKAMIERVIQKIVKSCSEEGGAAVFRNSCVKRGVAIRNKTTAAT